MKVSIIMLTYNRENVIKRMIESVLLQNFKDFEYIIVDNGSTDKSGSIADEYALKDNRIKVIHKSKGNIGSGRNAGISIATGEYIAFIDDDDYMEPEYIEYLYELAVRNRAEISICGSWREADGIKSPKYIFDGIYTYDSKQAVEEMIKREKFNSATPTKLISKRVALKVVFSEFSIYDDVEWTYKVLAFSEKIVVSGLPLYTFVRHDNNNSKGTTFGEKIDVNQIKIYLKVFAERTEWLTELFPENHEFWLYSEFSYILSMCDKTEGMCFQRELENILKSKLKTFLKMSQYYTERDKILIKKYGGVLNES